MAIKFGVWRGWTFDGSLATFRPHHTTTLPHYHTTTSASQFHPLWYCRIFLIFTTKFTNSKASFIFMNHNPLHYIIFIISVFYISWTICSRRLAVCLNSQRLHKNRLLSAPLIHSSVTMFALCMFLKFSCDALIYVTFSFGPSNLPISNDVCSNNHLSVSLILSQRGVDQYARCFFNRIYLYSCLHDFPNLNVICILIQSKTQKTQYVIFTVLCFGICCFLMVFVLNIRYYSHSYLNNLSIRIHNWTNACSE